MAVPNAPTEIVNLTLDLIKTETINDIEIPAEDKISSVCNRWYHIIRQNALEGFPWVFATKRASIPLNAEEPLFGYTDAYVLPKDYLSLSFIKEFDIPLSQWDYTIEGTDLCLDNGGAESMLIGYVYDMRDVTKWSPSFKILVAGQLAVFVVNKLTGNSGLYQRLTPLAKTLEVSAKAKNGMVNPPRSYFRSRMLESKSVYGHGGRVGRRYGRN